jgi:hypothetical protein
VYPVLIQVNVSAGWRFKCKFVVPPTTPLARVGPALGRSRVPFVGWDAESSVMPLNDRPIKCREFGGNYG